MTIHFRLTLDDLLALQKQVIHHSYTHHVKRMYFKWVLTIIVSLALLFLVNISLMTVFLTILVGIAIFIVSPIIYNNISFARYKSKINSNDYSHLLGQCQMTISEEGITRKLNEKETFFAWEQFDKREEDSSHFFLFKDDLQALIIPKQTNNMSEDDKMQYQQWIQSSIK